MPGNDPQGVEIGSEREVAVAALPRREVVAGDRVHLDVDAEEVGARLGSVVEDVFEEVDRAAALALEAALHVGHGDEHGVDPAVGHHLAQRTDRQWLLAPSTG